MKRLLGILASIMVSAVLMSGVAQAQAEDTRIVMDAFKDSIQQNNEKITINVVDPKLNLMEGNLEGYTPLNKFGRSIAGIQTTATDIWDRDDSQVIYVAPTQARLHNIKSSSASDDDPSGVGARTVRVYGLTDWDSGEVNEIIAMNGTANVSTVNAYVIINNMEVITNGATSSNVGIITATAVTDASVSAEINATEGQTNMTIHGISSTEKLNLNDWYGGIGKAVGTWLDFVLLVNSTPEIGGASGFKIRNQRSVQVAGNSDGTWPFDPPLVIAGPAIVKIQAISSTNDTDGFAGYNGILVDNNNNSPNNLAASDGRLLQDTHGRFLLHH